MFARITTVTLPPGTTTAGLLHVHDRLLRVLKTLPGFVRYAAMIDRNSPRAVAITYWKTEADLRVPATVWQQVRAEVFADAGVIDFSISEYEVAYHS